MTLCPAASVGDMDTLYALLSSEKYYRGNTVWERGDGSESLKLIVKCLLMSSLEDEQEAVKDDDKKVLRVEL